MHIHPNPSRSKIFKSNFEFRLLGEVLPVFYKIVTPRLKYRFSLERENLLDSQIAELMYWPQHRVFVAIGNQVPLIAVKNLVNQCHKSN